MEEKIKDFDRKIEQAMNESSVAPPFGMWNRISADLDAAPVAASSVGSFIPKAAIIGLLAVAVLETGFLVNYVVDNYNGKDNTPGIALSTTPKASIPVINTPAQIQQPVNEETSPVVDNASHSRVVVTTVAANIARVHKPATKPVAENAQPVSQNGNPLAPTLNQQAQMMEVSVPVTQSNVTANGIMMDQYYFPAIDSYAPEKVSGNTATKTDDGAVNKTDDRKVTKSTSVSEQKIRFKPPHRKKFHYGHLNRPK